MKKFCMLIALVVFALAFAPVYGQEYKKDSKAFVAEKKQASKANFVLTDYTWEFADGSKYPVYVNKSSGRCIVKKVSKKTGNEYNWYLPESAAKEICREIGIEYKEKEIVKKD